MPSLPTDLLFLICEQIASQQDFNSLFNCALACKQLAGSALLWLYRIHSQCGFFTNNEVADWPTKAKPEAWRDLQTERVVHWALLWKSIICSSLGTTYYPYCLYIRALDLRNLADLLDDLVFRGKVSGSFFADEMERFCITNGTLTQSKTRQGSANKQTRPPLNTAQILDLVGESITSFVSEAANQNRTSVSLEDLAGNISASSLSAWTYRLSRLKSLTLYDGAALSENVAQAIAAKCLAFNDLTFWNCTGDDADQKLATFFLTLRRGSLQSFEAINASSIGLRTLLALNHQSSSLKVLKLHGLKFSATTNLPLLQDCNNIETFEVHGLARSEGLISLEKTESDVFLGIVALFRQFNCLRELCFKNFAGTAEILAEVCLLDNVRLRKLTAVGYNLSNSMPFHRAVGHQTSLEWLKLTAPPDALYRDEIETLIHSSLVRLTNLTYLDILHTTNDSCTYDLQQLAASLLKLEEFAFGGYEIEDDLWQQISGLHYLTTLDCQALSFFSFNAMMKYISSLEETNKGLTMTIGYQAPNLDLTDQQQAIIREAIAAKVDGKFDFQLDRDADDDYDSESD